MKNLTKYDEYRELNFGEKKIEIELITPGGIEKRFKKYFLLDRNWVIIYKKNLKEFIDQKGIINDYLLKAEFILSKLIKKEFLDINSEFTFYFPSDFTIVTEKFINLLSKDFSEENKKIFEKRCYDIIFGGKCLIMKNYHKNNYSYAYISLYNEEKKEFSHEIDYFLKIDNRNNMEKALNFILTQGIMKYFQKINYDFKERYKNIYNNNCYIVRCGYLTNILDIKDSNNKVKIQNKIRDIQNIKEKMKVKVKEIKNIEKKKQKQKIDFIQKDEIDIHDITNKLNLILFCFYKIEVLQTKLEIHQNTNMPLTKLLIDLFQNYENENKSLFEEKIKELILESLEDNSYKSIIL